MRPGKAKTVAAQGLIEAALRGDLTEEQARRLYRLGPEVLTLALMAASKRIAGLQGLSPEQPPPLDAVGYGAHPRQARHVEATQEARGQAGCWGTSAEMSPFLPWQE